jgi:hypothetical protein
MKKTRLILIIVLIVSGILLLLVWEGIKPRRGDLFDTYTFEADSFTIKAETRYQDSYLLPLWNAYHDYYVRTSDSDRWKLIFTLIFDDPLKIPKKQIRKIDNQAVYVFIGWMYSVTTDGGKTWNTWNGNPKSAQFVGTGYGFIDDIIIDANGVGTMLIWNKDKKIVNLVTNNFGRTWSPK